MVGAPPSDVGCGQSLETRLPSSAAKLPKQPRGEGGSSAQRRFLAFAAESSEAEGDSELDSLLERFWMLVDRLEETFEPSTWQAFWLTTFENLNSAEAAQVLNITPAAVRLAKARVVRRIRREDGNLADELKIIKERRTSDA